MQELERRGKWYLPGKGRRKVNGVLRFTPSDSALLELDGLLDEHTDFLLTPIILGETNRGEEVTLYQCRQKNVSLGSKANSSSFRADVVFIGAHFLSEERMVFERFLVEFSHLQYWKGKTGFQFSRKSGENGRGVVIEYTEQEPVVLSNTESITIYYTTIWSAKPPRTETSVREQAFIRVDIADGSSFDQSSEIVRIIQNFLSLVATEPVLIRSFAAFTKQGRSKRSKEVNIYYAPIYPNDAKETRGNDLLFTLQEVAEHIDTHLRRWIENERALEPVYNLFFANLYRPYIYAENRFLNLAQAVETYHRRTYGGKYQDDALYLQNLYQIFLNVIPADVDPAFRASLEKGKLRYANEYSLSTRLNHLIKLLRNYLPEDFLPSSKKRGFFVQDVVNTRNYLTHYSEELEEKAADRQQLYFLEQGLVFILVTCFLKDIELPAAQVRKFLVRSRLYRLIKQLQR